MKDGIPPQIPVQDIDETGFIISKAEQEAIISMLNASSGPKALSKGTQFPPDSRLHGNRLTFDAIKDENGNILVLYDKTALGKGAYGSVLVAQVIQSADPRMEMGSFCAVKIQALKREKDALKVQQEDAIGRMLSLNYSSFVGGRLYYSVMPLLHGEVLSKAIPTYIGQFKKDEKPEGTFDNPADFNVNYYLSLFLRMTEAVARAHEAGILHLDIKPDNMMMDETGKITLIDFGTSKIQGQVTTPPADDAVGTPVFMAPEFFNEEYQGKFSTKQDIYSLARAFELAMYSNILKLDPNLFEQRASSPSLNEFLMYVSSHLKDIRLPNPDNSPDITAINHLFEVVQVMKNSTNPDYRPEAGEVFLRLKAIQENYEADVKLSAQSGYTNKMMETTAYVTTLLKDLKKLREGMNRAAMRGITPMYQQSGNNAERITISDIIYEIDKVKNELKSGKHLDAEAVYSIVNKVVEKHANEHGNKTEKLCHRAMTDIQQRMVATDRRKLHASQ